ncbi:MAG: restriction endonuclease subunit S [Pseudomonadota bacterium]
MSCEGKTVKLCEIADVIMGQSPKSEYYNTEGNGLPFFQGCSEFGEMYPTVKKYCSKPNRIAQKGDVLMSVRAPIGTLNLADRQCCIGRGLCAIRSKSANRFVYYLLKTNLDMIQTYGSGTIFRAINKAETNNLPFTVPSLPTQHKIAAILSAYDDLIENNLRRIKILEEMAQTIYREWFVKFRFPGHENVRMVDSPLGKIPEGWEVANLSDLVDTQYGYTESATVEKVGPKFLRGTDINKTSFVDWSQVPYCPIPANKRVYASYYVLNCL